jgi:hypothetical protein
MADLSRSLEKYLVKYQIAARLRLIAHIKRDISVTGSLQ